MPKDPSEIIEALRSTIGKMSIALDAISEAIVWTDSQGVIQWCNHIFTELVDRPSLSVLGHRLIDMLPLSEHGVLLPPDGHPERVVCQQGKSIYGVYDFQRGGIKHHLRFEVNCIEMDSQKSTVSIIRDLTGRKESEQERLLSAALQHAANAIAITNRQGHVRWVNRAFSDLTGYGMEEIYGRRLSILKSGLHDRAFYQKLWDAILAGSVWQGETINRKKDGCLYTERQTITPVKDEEGIISHFVAIKEDVSDRKKTEEELKNYRKRLEQMVEEKSQELLKAQKELVNRAMEAGMAHMAAIGLHNIGNAVTPINVLMETIRNQDLGKLKHYLLKCHEDLRAHMNDLGRYVSTDERGRQVFAYMENLIHSLEEQEKHRSDALDKMAGALQYISEVLTLQQMYAQSTQEIRELVVINVLLEDAVRLQKGAFQKRGISIICNYTDGLPKIIINKNRLMQVIINLIKNSYEAVEAKNLEDHSGMITITSFMQDEWIGFQIKDNGIGADSADIEKIGDIGTSKKGSSGFGLYYCRVFVESNHGKLSFNSPGIGKGSTVSVAFDRREVCHV